MGRVCVVGSINQDIVAEAERHPRPGETVPGKTLRFHPGGKGANQAVAAARAGAAASLIGCVGDDDAGRELLAVINGAGVACAGVQVIPGVPTGRGIITLVDGENSIVVIAGANSRVSRKQLEGVKLKAGDICVAQLETPVGTTAQAFRLARAAGATTLFNPAPAQQVPEELMDLSDILVVNVHEYRTIFDSGEPATSRFQGPVIQTLGPDGVAVWLGGTRTLIPGHPVPVEDTTGAGDCFVGYLAAGLAGGASLLEAARRANRAAAISVTRHGALSSIPLTADVEAPLRSDPRI